MNDPRESMEDPHLLARSQAGLLNVPKRLPRPTPFWHRKRKALAELTHHKIECNVL
jgi:hypothetical protein